MSKDSNVMSVALLSEIAKISDIVQSLSEQCLTVFEKGVIPTSKDESAVSVSDAIARIKAYSTQLRRTAILLASQSFTVDELVDDGDNE